MVIVNFHSDKLKNHSDASYKYSKKLFYWKLFSLCSLQFFLSFYLKQRECGFISISLFYLRRAELYECQRKS